MKRLYALISVAAAVALVAAVTGIFVSPASAVSVAPSATIATFTDGTGEVAGGPDISTVTVSLDDQVLSITAQVAGMPAFFTDGAFVFMLNTDSNPGTGGLGRGAEYAIFFDMKTFSAAVMHWNGSEFVAAEKVADPSRTLLGGSSVGFMFNLANFGSPTHIEFAVMVAKGPADAALIDVAPDSGLWAFDAVVPAPTPAPAPTPTPEPTPTPTPEPTPAPVPAPKPAVVKPLIGAAVTTPLAVIAGKRMTVTFLVKRSDNGKPLTSGTMICDPSVAGKVLPHAESFKAGKARLSFLVPKAASGKLLRVKVTIKVGTQSATKIATFRVK